MLHSGRTDNDTRTQIFNRKKHEHAAGTPARSSEGKGSQFKIVADRRNSILAGAGHPSGWVNRTAEMQHVARGDGATHLSAPAAHLGPVRVSRSPTQSSHQETISSYLNRAKKLPPDETK